MTSVMRLRDALLAWLTLQSTTLPFPVYRILLPHERRNMTVRQHPAILLGPCALVFAGLIAASLTSAVATSGTVALSAWIIWVILLLYLILKTVDWLESFFVVTSARIILTTGSVRRKVDIIPLNLLDEVTFKRSVLGRMLGYGSFTVTSRAPSQIVQKIDYVSEPDDLYLKVVDAVFMPRKIPCPQCHGEGAIWMPSGHEPLQVLREENAEADLAPGAVQSLRELLEAGFEKVTCSVCDGQGVVPRDLGE